MKKMWMIFIVLLMIIIPNSKVYALEDSFYEGEYLPNAYIKKFRANKGKYEQMRMFRRRKDNQFVYCIQLWEELQSNKNLMGYDSNQYIYANIDYSTWERIMLIAYYGYGYQDHTDSKWYTITQFMIWQETSPDSLIYFTDTLNGNRVKKYEQEINEINNLIQSHFNLPSFNSQNYQVKYKEQVTISDTNYILEKFNIMNDGGMTVFKNGNTLTFSNAYVGNSKITFLNADKRYQMAPIVYIDNNGQNLLAPGSYDPIYMEVGVELPYTDILINKMDIDNQTNIPQGDASLAGTKVQLLDSNYQTITEETIGKDGKLNFENIGYGTYYVKEIEAGRGYLLNQEMIFLEVNDNNTSINLYNQVIKNEIILTKYIRNSLTQKVELEEGAIFSIYNSHGEKIGSFTTNDNGIIKTTLPYGTYTIKQELGKKNHIYIEDFKIVVKEDGKIQTFDLYNEEITANIKIINLDQDSSLPILEKGAQFYVKDLENNQYIKNQNGNNIILETNDFGNTEFLTLSCGKYQVEQVKAVDNYNRNKNMFIFEINEEVEFQKDDNNRYLEIEVPNDKQKAHIVIEKNIEYYLNDSFLKKEKELNFSITIYAKEDIYSKDGIRIYEKDEEIYSEITENGIIQTPLLVYGNYYLKNDNNDIKIEIALTKAETKRIELLDKKYDYLKIDDSNSINVPNTLTKQTIFSKIPLVLIEVGFILIQRKKHYEN